MSVDAAAAEPGGLPFFLSSELAALGDENAGAGCVPLPLSFAFSTPALTLLLSTRRSATTTDWETLLNDLHGMVQAGFDVTSEGAFAAGAAAPAFDGFGTTSERGAAFEWPPVGRV